MTIDLLVVIVVCRHIDGRYWTLTLWSYIMPHKGRMMLRSSQSLKSIRPLILGCDVGGVNLKKVWLTCAEIVSAKEHLVNMRPTCRTRVLSHYPLWAQCGYSPTQYDHRPDDLSTYPTYLC